MTTLDAATYLVGYFTPIVGMIYIVLDLFVKNQMLNNRIAYWFFMLVIWLQAFAFLCDKTLK